MSGSAKKLHVKLGIFAAIPITLFKDPRVKPNSVKVYGALSSFEGTNEKSWPGYKKIAERAGLSTRAVADSLRNLVKTGWIRRTRLGLGKTNEYECLNYAEGVDTPSLMREIIAHQDRRKNNAFKGAKKSRIIIEKPFSKSPPGKTCAKKTRMADASQKDAPRHAILAPSTSLKDKKTVDRIKDTHKGSEQNMVIAAGLTKDFHLLSTLQYFFNKYTRLRKEDHPRYSAEKMMECMNILQRDIPLEDAAYTRELIDRYFSADLDCDYRLAHFVSGDIITLRAMESQDGREYIA